VAAALLLGGAACTAADPAPRPDRVADSGAGDAVVFLDACTIALAEREDGLVDFQLQGDNLATLDVEAVVQFFEDSVRIQVKMAPGVTSGVVPLVPVQRTDGHIVQEFFAARTDALQARVTVTASRGEAVCQEAISVPFRAWRDVSEGDCRIHGRCAQQDADLRLPTLFRLAESDAADRLGPLADAVTSRIHQQSGDAGPSYSVVMLEATGTPLQVTMVDEAALEATGQVDVSDDILGAYHLWWQGREVAITNGYPELDGHPSVIALLDQDEQLLGAVDPSADGLVLHHDGLVHRQSARASGSVAEIYGINWVRRPSGKSLSQKSTIVRFLLDTSSGNVVKDSLQTVFDMESVMGGLTYIYGNSISLTPCGADGSCWLGYTFANDTGFGDELEHAVAVAQALGVDGPEGDKLVFVNEGRFDRSLLRDTDGMRIIDLQADPADGQLPLDHIHKIKLFHEQQDGDVDRYRLILGALVRTADNATQNRRSRIFVYTIEVPQDPERDAQVSWVCGAEIDVHNQSHMDIVLPAAPHSNQTLAVGTANPYGETHYFTYDGSLQDDPTGQARCRLVARHEVHPDEKASIEGTAVNIWQKHTALQDLVQDAAAVAVDVDMDAVQEAYLLVD
jgi:hypothetical protein